MGFQRIKVRRDAEGEYLRYDGGLFDIEWCSEKVKAPGIGRLIYVMRAQDYHRNSKRLYLYRENYMKDFIGTARRRAERPTLNPFRDKSDGRFVHQYGVIAHDPEAGREAAQCQDCGLIIAYGGDRLDASYYDFDEFQIAEPSLAALA